jgi:hypothetical protein
LGWVDLVNRKESEDIYVLKGMVSVFKDIRRGNVKGNTYCDIKVYYSDTTLQSSLSFIN